jgi:hypothetical protein
MIADLESSPLRPESQAEIAKIKEQVKEDDAKLAEVWAEYVRARPETVQSKSLETIVEAEKATLDSEGRKRDTTATRFAIN